MTPTRLPVPVCSLILSTPKHRFPASDAAAPPCCLLRRWGYRDGQVYHDWAPLGAKRFVDLVEDGFFTDVAMYRCVKNFLVQFGISSDPEKKQYWREKGSIPDDPSLGMEFDRR